MIIEYADEARIIAYCPKCHKEVDSGRLSGKRDNFCWFCGHKMPWDTEDMFVLRGEGQTYQQIAEKYGISKQAIHTKLTKTKGRKVDIDKIIFKGIYQYFLERPAESITAFAQKVYGTEDLGNRPTTMKNFITGKNESALKVRHLKRICELTGMPFEETFDRREDLK